MTGETEPAPYGANELPQPTPTVPQPTPIVDTRDELLTIHREIGALQVAVAERKKPWYTDASTILSVSALLFSFGTTYVSNQRIAAQDVQINHQQLRTILQRLAALPKENVELGKKYADDPAAIATVSGFINQENTLLVRYAADLAKTLSAGTVSAIEYYAVALALQNAYDIRSAKEFMALAVEAASDFNTEVAARRGAANLEFLTGNPGAGRAQYAETMNIFARYVGYDPYTIGDTNIRTELSWAYSEASLADRSLVITHVENAERIASSLPGGPGTESLKATILQARTMFQRSGIGAGGTSQSMTPVSPRDQ